MTNKFKIVTAQETPDLVRSFAAAEPVFRREPQPDLQIIAEGLEFPEGPIALSDGSVLMVEIKGGKLQRIEADGKMTTVAHTGGGPNGAALGPDGHCYVTNNGGHRWGTTPLGPVPAGLPETYAGGKIQRVNLQSGAVDELYTEHQNGQLSSPNDLVFDAFGGFWFTDSGKVLGRQRNFGSVCYGKADGSLVREVIYPMVSPNGIGLSPSGDTLYVAETQTSRLWAFDIAGPGEISKKPWPSPNGGRLVCNVGGFRQFDSLAIDAQGYIHVGTLMDPGIAKIAPDGSTITHTAFPDIYTTNLCFGGADMRTVYVTLTQSGRLAAFPSPVAGLRLNYAK